MEKLTIVFINKTLNIEGVFKPEDSSCGFHEEFEVNEIKSGDIDLWDDYDEDDLQEIEELALIKYKENQQVKWENARV